jgi:hypothetical protein
MTRRSVFCTCSIWSFALRGRSKQLKGGSQTSREGVFKPITNAKAKPPASSHTIFPFPVPPSPAGMDCDHKYLGVSHERALRI